MTDKEAYNLIGERANALAGDTIIQSKMLEIALSDGKEAAEKWLYQLAIATLAQ